MTIKFKLKKNAKKIDRFLLEFLKKQKKSLLIAPMKYGVISGGKKIRSTIIFDTGKMLKVEEKKLLSVCTAVECIHSYSLIHDDLPCMDNDLIRRGKPSTHKKFGEATAVLAGNSLLTLAFEIISNKKNFLSPKQKNEIINLLSYCSGHTGIAGGQELDLKFENKRKKLSQIIDMQKKNFFQISLVTLPLKTVILLFYLKHIHPTKEELSSYPYPVSILLVVHKILHQKQYNFFCQNKM